MSAVIPVLAAIALVVGAFLAAVNWFTFFSATADGGMSPVPVFGGLLLILGLLAFEQTRWFAWIGLAVDYPGSGRIVGYAVQLAWHRLTKRSSSAD